MAKRLTVLDFSNKYTDGETGRECVFRVRFGDCPGCP